MLSTGITTTGTRYTAAADDLHRQMPEFNFVTYKTSDNGLHLTSGTQANDAWTLTHEDAALTYTVSPLLCRCLRPVLQQCAGNGRQALTRYAP